MIPITVLVLGLAAVVVLMAVQVGEALVDREQARHAADAAALAGALAGREAAEQAAWRNGATLERLTRSGEEVTVQVRRGWFRASARARREAHVVARDLAMGQQGAGPPGSGAG